MSSLNIRFAETGDASALLDIYRPYVTDTLVTFELEAPTVQEFAERIRSISSFFPYIVAELDGEIAGYAYAHSFRERAAYDWAVETSIYVSPKYHRMGVGAELYRRLEELLARQGVTCAVACITYPNPDSIAFHERMGYSMCGRIDNCAFKLGQWCSVVFMQKLLRATDMEPEPVKSIKEI